MFKLDLESLVSNWSPFLLTILFIALLYWLSRYILDRQVKRNEGGSVLRSVILFCIALVGFIMIILAMPLSESLKGQISSLIGIVIAAVLSLGSATFFGNGLAGVLLRSINNFKPGDFIKVGDTFGRVSERGLFHTEVQTEDRDLITLPNMFLANNPVKVIRSSGTFISGVCSLGYDVHHGKVKKALIEAAENAGLEDAFVLVKELGDFSIVYQVLGLLKDAKTIISSRSRLNSAILDSLHEAGIEIVSPNFMNQRIVTDTVFVPKKLRKSEQVVENEKVEDLIFDKAEQAESIQKSMDSKEDIEERIRELKVSLKDEKEAEIKEKINARINKYELLLERMKERIDTKIENLDK